MKQLAVALVLLLGCKGNESTPGGGTAAPTPAGRPSPTTANGTPPAAPPAAAATVAFTIDGVTANTAPDPKVDPSSAHWNRKSDTVYFFLHGDDPAKSGMQGFLTFETKGFNPAGGAHDVVVRTVKFTRYLDAAGAKTVQYHSTGTSTLELDSVTVATPDKFWKVSGSFATDLKDPTGADPAVISITNGTFKDLEVRGIGKP